jgi:hypothetical protein
MRLSMAARTIEWAVGTLCVRISEARYSTDLHQENTMRSKRTVPRKRVSKQKIGRSRKRSAVLRAESGVRRQLLDLREQVDIVLPEMTARVAALEHLLLELTLCTRDDLRRAREFVRTQEA